MAPSLELQPPAAALGMVAMWDWNLLGWAAAGILAYAVFLFGNPWAGAFRRGLSFCRRHPGFWVMLGIVAAQQIWWLTRGMAWSSQFPSNLAPASLWEQFGPAVPDTLRSLVGTLWLPVPPEPVSVLLAPLFLLNVAGLRAGLFRGAEAGMGKWGYAAGVALLGSAAARTAWFAAAISGKWQADSFQILWLHALGSLWSGATVAFALAWLIRFAETSLRSPEEILLIQWPTGAAARIVRLWPVVLSVAILQLLPASVRFQNGWLIFGCVLALLTAFAPLLLVHWRQSWGWRRFLIGCRDRLGIYWGRLLWWLLVAATHFLLFHAVTRAFLAVFPAQNLWSLIAQSIHALAHAALKVWMLAAWVSLQPPFSEGDALTIGHELLVEKRIHAKVWQRFKVKKRRSDLS